MAPVAPKTVIFTGFFSFLVRDGLDQPGTGVVMAARTAGAISSA
jgi:hypothetical protein